MAKDPKLKKAGVSGYNKPKRTPNHPTKSHVVVAKVGDKTKTIRFGQQGVKGAGKNPKTKKSIDGKNSEQIFDRNAISSKGWQMTVYVQDIL